MAWCIGVNWGFRSGVLVYSYVIEVKVACKLVTVLLLMIFTQHKWIPILGDDLPHFPLPKYGAALLVGVGHKRMVLLLLIT